MRVEEKTWELQVEEGSGMGREGGWLGGKREPLGGGVSGVGGKKKWRDVGVADKEGGKPFEGGKEGRREGGGRGVRLCPVSRPFCFRSRGKCACTCAHGPRKAASGTARERLSRRLLVLHMQELRTSEASHR